MLEEVLLALELPPAFGEEYLALLLDRLCDLDLFWDVYADAASQDYVELGADLATVEEGLTLLVLLHHHVHGDLDQG